MTFLLPLIQKAAYPAMNFPTTAATISRPPTINVCLLAGRRVQDPHIHGGGHRHEEDRHEEMAEMGDSPLDLVSVLCSSQQETSGERTDDHGRARHGRQPRQSERQHDRQDGRSAGKVHSACPTHERGTMNLPTSKVPARNPNAMPVVFATPTTVTSCPCVKPTTTARITSPITSSMTAAPRMISLSGSFSRLRSDRTVPSSRRS